MSYKVKEIFYTLQGEGFHAGRPAVFCRFSLCNLWTGREKDRKRAVCKFCDTDFLGGKKYKTAEALADAIEAAWPSGTSRFDRMVVLTGGEPTLQVDFALVAELKRRFFYVAIETNGTGYPPGNVDWRCVSPKAGADLVVSTGSELKFVYPQEGLDPRDFQRLGFAHFSVQPMDGPDLEANTKAAVEFCLANPKWRLSLQTHKHLGIR